MTLSDFAKNLKAEKSVAIFCHVRPDGDTLGSSFALKKALGYLGVTAEVFCEDPVPAKYDFFSEPLTVKPYPVGDYTAFIAVDVADGSRLGGLEKVFARHKNTYSIDHHVSNTRFADKNLVLEEASDAENVFKLILEMGVNVSSFVADLLAMGIITDTGNFKHKNVTAATLEAAAELVKYGADLNKIIYNTFTKQTKERAKLFGLVMSGIRYFNDFRIAFITVGREDIVKSGAKPDETEGFIDFVMSIDSVEIGACIMETDKNKYKISLRSKGPDVNAVAGVFGGGGHVLASGCQICGDYEEVVDKLRYAVSQYLTD